jgi:hypothetical protein
MTRLGVPSRASVTFLQVEAKPLDGRPISPRMWRKQVNKLHGGAVPRPNRVHLDSKGGFAFASAGSSEIKRPTKESARRSPLHYPDKGLDSHPMKCWLRVNTLRLYPPADEEAASASG